MVELENQRLSLVERPEDEMVREERRSFSTSTTWIHMSSFSRAAGYNASGLRTTR